MEKEGGIEHICETLQKDCCHKDIEPVLTDTFVEAVKNSAGTKIFQRSFAKVRGETVDIMRGGDLSCAYFASGLLFIFGLLDRIYTTVKGLRFGLDKSGWRRARWDSTDYIPEGAVIFWEPQQGESGELHGHAGFYIGYNKAVSNSSSEGCPVVHDVFPRQSPDGPYRKITEVWINKKLHPKWWYLNFHE